MLSAIDDDPHYGEGGDNGDADADADADPDFFGVGAGLVGIGWSG